MMNVQRDVRSGRFFKKDAPGGVVAKQQQQPPPHQHPMMTPPPAAVAAPLPPGFGQTSTPPGASYYPSGHPGGRCF